MKFMAPIPGMSLTREPGNAPWEQPALYDTPEQALAFYLDKFDDEDRLDDLLFSLEAGYPVESLVDFLTSYSVMEGYHSIDIKTIISPVLHEYLIALAEAADIPYVETAGPSKEEKIKARDKKRSQILLSKSLGGAMAAPTDENVEKAEGMIEEGGAEEAPLIQRRG